ncbi:ATP-binding cassette domain-containing protein [Saccharopolyspora gregorii]|uniref:ABC transporter domain-containing protein n=1 Tax=Saccharopolyspora gregorii TaxID=33914 RepID=A0ABP6RKG1_9PSEU
MAAAPEHPSTALLEARNLTTFPQLFGVDFALARGTVAALDGPSREPKTWLLQVLAGLRRPDAGAVLFDGVRIDELGDHELREVRQRRFGFLFADGMLVPELTTAENCALPQMLAGADRPRRWTAPRGCCATSAWSGCGTASPGSSPPPRRNG